MEPRKRSGLFYFFFRYSSQPFSLILKNPCRSYQRSHTDDHHQTLPKDEEQPSDSRLCPVRGRRRLALARHVRRTELIPEVALDTVIHGACRGQDFAVSGGLDHKDRLGGFGDGAGRRYHWSRPSCRDGHGDGRGGAIDHADCGDDGRGRYCCDGGATRHGNGSVSSATVAAVGFCWRVRQV